MKNTRYTVLTSDSFNIHKDLDAFSALSYIPFSEGYMSMFGTVNGGLGSEFEFNDPIFVKTPTAVSTSFGIKDFVTFSLSGTRSSSLQTQIN